jgi:hypothetical protein
MRTENYIASTLSQSMKSAINENDPELKIPTKDITLNLNYAEHGVRAFVVIAGAFTIGATQWLYLIPLVFYFWFSALTGFSVIKALITKLLASNKKQPAKNSITFTNDNYREAA